MKSVLFFGRTVNWAGSGYNNVAQREKNAHFQSASKAVGGAFLFRFRVYRALLSSDRFRVYAHSEFGFLDY